MNSKIESGVQLFSRIKPKSYLKGINRKLFPDEGLQQNSIIEITGTDRIEKYKLILDFLIRCILPSDLNEEWRECGVIFINTDHQINLMDVVKAIDLHLKTLNIKTTTNIIEKALTNLTIVHCYTCDQFVFAIHNLERVVNSNDNQNLILIDNITPYYWISRFFINNLSIFSLALQKFDMLYSIVKNLNITLIFIRNEAIENKKRFSLNIDYRINIEKASETTYNALVTNYVKENETCITYKSENILQFL